jgi:hypothetical protein
MMIFPLSLLLFTVVFFAFSAYHIKKNASIDIDEGHWEKRETGDFSSSLFYSLFFSVTIFLECITASVSIL